MKQIISVYLFTFIIAIALKSTDNFMGGLGIVILGFIVVRLKINKENKSQGVEGRPIFDIGLHFLNNIVFSILHYDAYSGFLNPFRFGIYFVKRVVHDLPFKEDYLNG